MRWARGAFEKKEIRTIYVKLSRKANKRNAEPHLCPKLSQYHTDWLNRFSDFVFVRTRVL